MAFIPKPNEFYPMAQVDAGTIFAYIWSHSDQRNFSLRMTTPCQIKMRLDGLLLDTRTLDARTLRQYLSGDVLKDCQAH